MLRIVLNFNLRIVSFIIFISVSNLNFAQPTNLEQADSLIAINQCQLANNLLEKSAQEHKKTKEYEQLVTTYILKTQCELPDLAQAQKQLDTANYYANTYLIPTNSLAWNYAYNNQAFIFQKKSNFPKANSYLKQIIKNEKFLKKENPRFLAVVYNNLGLNTKKEGDFENAIHYFKQSLSIKDSLKTETNSLYSTIVLARGHNNISQAYEFIENHSAANYHLLKSITLYEKAITENPKLKTRLGAYYINMAVHYQNRNQLDSAALFLKKSKPFIKQNQAQLFRFHKFQAVNFQKQNQIETAQNHLDRAIEIQLSRTNKKSNSTGKLYLDQARLHQARANRLQALQSTQKALTQLTPSFNNEKDYSQNPNPTTAGSKIDLLEALELKAELLQDIDKKNAVKTYEVAIQTVTLIQQDIRSQTAKFFLGEQRANLYENALKIAYELYFETKEPQYANRAFLIAERSKAASLLEAVRKAEALGNSQIPDSLQIRLYDLKTEIVYCEHLQKEDTILSDQLFQLKQEEQKLINELEEKYPQYFLTKHKNSIATIPHIQSQLLDSKTGLLEYYAGKDHMYQFFLTENSLDFKQIQFDCEIENTILEYLAMFEHPELTTGENGLNRYQKLAFKIYQHVYTDISFQDYPNMIIIPDGLLAYMPFEALVTKNKTSHYYHDLPYLLHQQTISYSFSASVLSKTSKPVQKKEINVLAMAPFASELPYSKKEVFQIGELTNSTILIHQRAVKQKFLELAKDFGILHLSTHANAGQEKETPFIRFYDKPMHLHELLAQRFSAQLVILSACETQKGDYKAGDGVQSIAMGFAYTGVPSLVASLWSVNDQSTASIITQFYKGLSRNEDKAKALQIAKQQYLESLNVDALASPYYWAPFIQVGDKEPVTIRASRSVVNYLIYLFTVLVFLIGILLFDDRKVFV